MLYVSVRHLGLLAEHQTLKEEKIKKGEVKTYLSRRAGCVSLKNPRTRGQTVDAMCNLAANRPIVESLTQSQLRGVFVGTPYKKT